MVTTRSSFSMLAASLLLLVLGAGCPTTPPAPSDPDAGVAPELDASVPDEDAGTPDAAVPVPDAGLPDASVLPGQCVTAADCAAPGKCPTEATKGCACATTPQGARCVPQCTVDADCPKPPDQTLVCSSGLCRGQGGGGGGGGNDGGSPGMDISDTVSDQAQAMTIAFDGLAFVTGDFCSQTFYPPGKVADFFGFQYLRDNDPTNLGHNTSFTTLTADPVLVLLDATQVEVLADLGDAEQQLSANYGLMRLPLAYAFRRLFTGATPAGHPALDFNAVRAYSGALFAIDGEMSYLRAQAYATVLNSLTPAQKATLDAMKGTGAGTWTQPAASAVATVLHDHPSRGDLRTYAGEMLSWYLGGVAPDVYFCPERQGTYFGSFFMKDVKAMHNPNYTIDANMTADMGDAFLATLDATTQRPYVTGLVAQQKDALTTLVARRETLSRELRTFLSNGTASHAAVLNLSKEYGALDGEISARYATAFSSLNLTPAQRTSLTALRKTATAEDGGTPDYDLSCGNGYLYSAPLQSPPTLTNTDFLFGVCAGQGTACSRPWDCCSFDCVSSACTAPFTFTSSAFVDGGTLPVTYTCDGSSGLTSVNPPLAWSGVPAGTVELALTFTTIALDGTRYNWVLFHVPASVTSLAAGTTVGVSGVSSDGPDLRYYPPCSSGPGLKSYTFTLYALSAAPSFSVPNAQVTGPLLEAALAPLTLQRRELVVTYTRP